MNRQKTDIKICQVCKSENPLLTITCQSCGAYIRDRVPGLHLFETLWMLIEFPYQAMQRIVLAQQKNYVFPIQMMFGFAYVTFIFWVVNIGLVIENLQSILFLILVIGPITGLMILITLSLVTFFFFRVQKVHVKYRDINAVLSYSVFPIILSIVFIFPVEVAIFGMYLFTNEPSPFSINPMVYTLVIGLDFVFIIWSLGILFIGLRVISGSIIRTIGAEAIIIILIILPVIPLYLFISMHYNFL
jgi:hypothetical protein